MTQKVNNREYNKLNKDIQGLDLLKRFRDQWNASDKKMQDIWTSFRLLPLKVAYLIASHYQYTQSGWSLRTKWNLYTKFDKKLRKNENPGKITSSIDSAVETQQKIVGLQKVFAILKDKSIKPQDKAHAYEGLKKDHPDLYQDVIHKIGIVKGKSISRAEAELEIAQEPNGCSKAVIKNMLYLFKEGHPDPKDYFFKDLPKKNSSFGLTKQIVKHQQF